MKELLVFYAKHLLLTTCKAPTGATWMGGRAISQILSTLPNDTAKILAKPQKYFAFVFHDTLEHPEKYSIFKLTVISSLCQGGFTFIVADHTTNDRAKGVGGLYCDSAYALLEVEYTTKTDIHNFETRLELRQDIENSSIYATLHCHDYIFCGNTYGGWGIDTLGVEHVHIFRNALKTP